MLANLLKGASAAAALSGVVLVDAHAQAGGAAVSLNIGQDQPNRVLIFACYVRTAPINGTPTALSVNGTSITTTGTNASGSSGYLYGVSNGTAGTTCSFQPSASSTIDGYVVVVWAVYGLLAGVFSDTSQSEASSTTSRTAAVGVAGDLLFALAVGGAASLALQMGTDGVVDSSLSSFTTTLGTTFYYLAGHRDPSSTASVSCTQSSSAALLLYIASAT